MQLNGIDIEGYSVDGNLATFMVLAGPDGLGALQGTNQFKVTEDGRDHEDFGGYDLLNVRYVTDDRTEVTIMRKLTSDMLAVLKSVLANLNVANVNIDNAAATANAANDTADRATRSALTANTLAEANAAAIEELAATVFAE